jgi:hypothetical protein
MSDQKSRVKWPHNCYTYSTRARDGWGAFATVSRLNGYLGSIDGWRHLDT